jgi:adenylate cyclase
VVAEIAADPGKLALGGERRELTCYFSDLENFTTISEGLTPERLASLMNRSLGVMTETVLESKGTLDKYIGDAIMAFWGAPMPRPDHALTACRVALENQARLAVLRRQLEAEGFPPVRTRIGLNSGPASVGNMGTARRFSYTALGDTVNLASRLEGANKAYGTYILISETTRAGAGDGIEVRELDVIKVKGKTKPVRVYELLGLKGATDPRLLEKSGRFASALALFRARRWAEAAGAFEGVKEDFSNDHAAELYILRCKELSASPPPDGWDGSFALTEK